MRLEEAGVPQPALVAGPEGVQLVVIFADRRALRTALDERAMQGPLSDALSPVLEDLQSQLTLPSAS